MKQRTQARTVTLGKRLFLTFGAIIALLFILSATIFTTVQTNYRFLTTVQEDLFGIEALSLSVARSFSAIDNYLHSGRQDYLAEYDSLQADSLKKAAVITGRLPGDLKYGMNDILNMIRTFDEYKIEAVRQYDAGLEAIYVNRSVAELSRLTGYIRAECSRILSSLMKEVDYQVTGMLRSLAQTESFSWLILLFVTIACVFLALRVTRDISRPVHELVASLESFASGKLDIPPLERKKNDEISILIHSFNQMTVQIRGFVEKIRRESELEKALKQSELETLQARINPHFLFNTLNTISALADIESAEKTKGAVGSLAILLRNQLESARSFVCLDQEFESAEHYLRIQEIRFGSRLRHSILREEGTGSLQIPGMIIQPFVENAVIHGLEPLEEGGMVSIDAKIQGGDLVIDITDDGRGFDPCAERMEESRAHTGILNVSRRLELLYGSPVVGVESAPGQGTRVRIRIPDVAASGPTPPLLPRSGAHSPRPWANDRSVP